MKNFVCPSGSARTTQNSCARPVYLIAILLALVSFVAPAQSRPLDSPAGSVHGTVLVISPDGRSHVASGAQVRLIGATKDASQLAVADYSGRYKFDGVPAGGYQLEVALGIFELDIFEKVAKPITIRAGETTVEDVKLELKGVGDEVTVKAERVGLKLRDASATEPSQQPLQLVQIVNLSFPGKLTLNVKGSLASTRNGLTVDSPEASHNTFNLSSSRPFVSAPNPTVHFPGFFSPKMSVLKSYRLRVSPRVSLGNQIHGRRTRFPDVQDCYPREFQIDLANANPGVFSNGVGRVFGMRFVIEKK
jgi:hypothetical protein